MSENRRRGGRSLPARTARGRPPRQEAAAEAATRFPLRIWKRLERRQINKGNRTETGRFVSHPLSHRVPGLSAEHSDPASAGRQVEPAPRGARLLSSQARTGASRTGRPSRTLSGSPVDDSPAPRSAEPPRAPLSGARARAREAGPLPGTH